MCGRFTLCSSRTEIARAFALLRAPEIPARFNLAPTQPAAVVREVPAGSEAPHGSLRELAFLHWGLIPSWADDPASGSRMINARAETADTKPAFRQAFRQRRCLVPADGFFEWKKQGRRKQPFHIRRRDGQPFGFAGLWERWQRGDRVIESCTILTTEANALLADLHTRMPAIIDPVDYGLWLDAAVQEVERLKPLLRPYPVDDLEAVAVSARVNSPANDDAQCLEPVRVQRPLELFPDQTPSGAHAADREQAP